MPHEPSPSPTGAPVNILTLKWGDRYGPVFVNRLYRAIDRHLARPFRFLCFTDDGSGLLPQIEPHPLPSLDLPEYKARSTWLKLGLFADGLADMEGDCLFLDLDLLIVEGIDCFFEYEPGRRCIIHNWTLRHQISRKRPEIGNSSVFRWRAGTTQFIVNRFLGERDWALQTFDTAEQSYVTLAMGERLWWPEAWVRSFKRHSVPAFPLNLVTAPKLPADTRILVFHGRPDPDQALDGWRSGRLHRRTRPAPWIEDHWHDRPDNAARTDS
ncbi:MAG: hypothetical protein OXC10_01440 [Rhodospirillaceae bacterium]|nr:hypothetical protein [Rhodospirillaceae bacterium]